MSNRKLVDLVAESRLSPRSGYSVMKQLISLPKMVHKVFYSFIIKACKWTEEVRLKRC